MKKFNIKDIKKFLIQTGFPFEMKMAKILENKDYSVQVGKFFTDLEDDKKREIDVIASKKINDINVHLIIECKQSLKDAWIFLSPEKNPGRYWNHIKYVPEIDFNHKKKAFDKIHVFNTKIPLTRNFITFNGKKKSDPTHIKDAIQKVIKANIAYVATFRGTRKRNLFFPIILFSGSMFVVSYPGYLKAGRENHIQYSLKFEAPNYIRTSTYSVGVVKEVEEERKEEIKRAYSDLGAYFLIDLVNESKINNYLKLIEKEVKDINKKNWRIKRNT